MDFALVEIRSIPRKTQRVELIKHRGAERQVAVRTEHG
jgi:hypothetical protein